MSAILASQTGVELDRRNLDHTGARAGDGLRLCFGSKLLEQRRASQIGFGKPPYVLAVLGPMHDGMEENRT